MKKFITLNVPQLRLDNLSGLIFETIDLSVPQTAVLGAVGAAGLQALVAAHDTLHLRMKKQRASLLTPVIGGKDKQRDRYFAEIKRTAKAANESTQEIISDAGNKIVEFIRPFWNISKEHLMSQTGVINIIAERYDAAPDLQAAAAQLGLASIFQLLFAANTDLSNLYAERLNEMAAIEGPSASSFKDEMVTAYNVFCTAVEITLRLLPSDGLQRLFNELNSLRRKYISRLPVPLSRAYTSVAPIPLQVCTGKPVTPLPCVSFQTGKGSIELVFAQDFNVTYRNNINPGEARLVVHGKGKYTGAYATTFHIVEEL